jgi:hypothetical protein
MPLGDFDLDLQKSIISTLVDIYPNEMVQSKLMELFDVTDMKFEFNVSYLSDKELILRTHQENSSQAVRATSKGIDDLRSRRKWLGQR